MAQPEVLTAVWSPALQPRAFWIPIDEARAILSAVEADRGRGMHLHVGEMCVAYSEVDDRRIVHHLGKACPPGATLEVPEAEVELEELEPETEVESFPVAPDEQPR